MAMPAAARAGKQPANADGARLKSDTQTVSNQPPGSEFSTEPPFGMVL
jgi:hypothetical protein